MKYLDVYHTYTKRKTVNFCSLIFNRKKFITSKSTHENASVGESMSYWYPNSHSINLITIDYVWILSQSVFVSVFNFVFVLFLQKLGDIESNLNDFNVPVEDEPILNNETKNGLMDLANSNVDAINFQKFFNEARNRNYMY